MEFNKLLRRIAIQYGVSTEEVYNEMQSAIDMAFDNPDPSVRAAWKDIQYAGERPTPEEVIFALANRLRDDTRLN